MNNRAFFEQRSLEQCNLEQSIVELIQQQLHLAAPPVDADLFETGCLDSLTFVSLLIQLETTFNVHIALADLELERFRTISGIASYLTEHREKSQNRFRPSALNS